ncbi:MAG: hypothetical protein Q4D96_07815 [Propionibacteriaceae bacterium]|nr:hypothetical protein [Propionibacteriaceae bacterium]
MGSPVGFLVGVVAFLGLLVGCSAPPSPPVDFDDVVVFEPPPGYETRRVDGGGAEPDWQVVQWFPPKERGQGGEDGSGMLIRSGMEDRDPRKPSVATFEQYCAGLLAAVEAESGVSKAEVLRDRQIDDSTACGVAWQQGEGDQRQVMMRWDLCRRDGCWSFQVHGARGSDVVSGSFLSFLQTVRFVPKPPQRSDLVFPEPTATNS